MYMILNASSTCCFLERFFFFFSWKCIFQAASSNLFSLLHYQSGRSDFSSAASLWTTDTLNKLSHCIAISYFHSTQWVVKCHLSFRSYWHCNKTVHGHWFTACGDIINAMSEKILLFMWCWFENYWKSWYKIFVTLEHALHPVALR